MLLGTICLVKHRQICSQCSESKDSRRASQLKADIFNIRVIKTYFWCLLFSISSCNITTCVSQCWMQSYIGLQATSRCWLAKIDHWLCITSPNVKYGARLSRLYKAEWTGKIWCKNILPHVNVAIFVLGYFFSESPCRALRAMTSDDKLYSKL